MKRFAVALAALFTLGACATASAPTVAPALEIAPLDYSFRELPNGLRVYAMPDDNTSTVSVQVWYDVGSKDDPEGRSGFAHLFEHMLFKQTRNLVPEQFDRLTEDVGGFNNASTWDDFTNYYEVVPAHHLERLLWAEAERMGSLVVDEATFMSERDVVKEEYRQGILAQPYGKLFYYLTQTGFSVHPYGRPGIGSIEELDAATVDDVRAFHAQYYRPDNAVLVVAGNFNPAQFDQWVDRYFAPIATPEREIPRVTAVEPVRAGPRDFTVYEPNTPLPAIAVSYPAPAARDPDMPALMVLDGILSTGESSRMYQAMVYDQQVAAEVFTSFEATQDPGLYVFGAILSEGETPDAGLASLNAEIARVRDTLATDAELDEAKSELISAALENRETAYGRAYELAESVTRYRDPDYSDQILEAVQRVTAADVQRVARKWFDDQRRVVLRYLPEESANGAVSDAISVSSTIQAPRIVVPQSEVPVLAAASDAERVAPPTPGAPVEARMPAPVERTLGSGLRVIVASERDLPLVSAQLRVLSGSVSDPSGRSGVASLVTSLITQGTPTRSATDIARQVESLGASLDAAAGAETSTLALQTRSDRVEEAFDLFADVALNPVFADEELERQRSLTVDELSVSMRQPRALAAMAMSRMLYGDGAYGAVTTPTTLAAITQADVQNFHDSNWRMDNAVLVIAGDVSAEEGFALAERYFGSATLHASARPTPPRAGAAPAPRAVLIDLPDSGQAGVGLGVRGPRRSDADYFPTVVANSVLGGGYSARLNQEIRIRRGLSYGASSSLPQRREPAPVLGFAQTRNDAAVQVVGLMQAGFRDLGAAPIPAAELEARQANLIGAFARDVETTSGLAGQLAQVAAFGLPLEALASYIDDVAAVTPEQAQAAARRYYDPAQANLIVVGDGAVFYDDLRRAQHNIERIPVDDLDLGAPALR